MADIRLSRQHLLYAAQVPSCFTIATFMDADSMPLSSTTEVGCCLSSKECMVWDS